MSTLWLLWARGETYRPPRRLCARDEPVDQRPALARHPRTRHHQLEARLLGALADVGLDVGVERQRADAGWPADPDLLNPFGCVEGEVDDQRVRADQVLPQAVGVGHQHRLVPRGTQRPDHAGAKQQVRHEGDDAGHATRYCARICLNSWRTDSGRPHISSLTISTRPSRTSRTASSPSIPASSSSLSAVWTAGAAAAWPNRWATRIRQCQS